ncbi:MAG: hypothetical protein RQ732_02735 [Methylophaga sp.]|nr:hypothetical protein [Methylophaga sp.]
MNILTINSGSSSLKASLFMADGTRHDRQYRCQQNILDQALPAAFKDLRQFFRAYQIDVIGHRFVHGGDCPDAARMLDADELKRLAAIADLAPLHMPANLAGVDFCRQHFSVPQFACFDTAFHQTLPASAWRLPVPKKFGLRRYGFHGINYAHIARQLPDLLADTAYKNVLIAHLGSGASICLLQNLQSVATSMGYSPAGGIPMATRSGDLDPGVMLKLAAKTDIKALTDMVFHQMGLLALSDGESGDMATLLKSNTLPAAFAVSYFCEHVRGAIGHYAAQVGGLDTIVFTAGIGEHAAGIRQQIIQPLAFMGFMLDTAKNEQQLPTIHDDKSKPVLVIPADEAAEIATLVRELYH